MKNIEKLTLSKAAGSVWSPPAIPGTPYATHQGGNIHSDAGGNLPGGVRVHYPEHGFRDWLKHITETTPYGYDYAPRRDPDKFPATMWETDERLGRGPNMAGRWPDINSTASIYDIMRLARPEALGDVMVNAGVSPEDDYWRRHLNNERRGGFRNDEETRQIVKNFVDEYKGIFAREETSYHPTANSVFAPDLDPAALIHELGHAIDYNESILGNEKMDPGSTKAKIRAWLRDKYMDIGEVDVPFTDSKWKSPLHPYGELWKEHTGWDKGVEAYMEGAAKKKFSWDEIEDTIKSVIKSEDPALATYWSGNLPGMLSDALGGVAGLGAYRGTRNRFQNKRFIKNFTGRNLKGRAGRGILGTLAAIGASNSMKLGGPGAWSEYGLMENNVAMPIIRKILAHEQSDEDKADELADYKEQYKDMNNG